jgi:OmpA-OmpF porin, OOP family
MLSTGYKERIMFKKQMLALGLTGLAAIATAQADEFLDDRFYIAPFGTYLHPGGDRQGSDGWGAGGAIGKIINEYFNVELRGFWTNYSHERPGVGGQTDLIGGTVDLQYFLFRDTFSPYVVAALGGQNTSARFPGTTGFSGASFIFQAGLGATYELADNFLLRADARYQLDTLPGSLGAGNRNAYYPNHPDVLNDLVVNVGFVVPLGDKPTPTKVEPVAAAAPDECSTRDTDHDGVNDCDDKCPGTAAGTKVDDQGCPIRIELRGVNFLYDSAELTSTAKGILDGVAEQLISMPGQKDIEVAGHTSTEGTAAHNQKLSQRRSASVVEYLKRKGVTNRLHPKGYGEDYPLVKPDKTEVEREKNRRVELIWMGD